VAGGDLRKSEGADLRGLEETLAKVKERQAKFEKDVRQIKKDQFKELATSSATSHAKISLIEKQLKQAKKDSDAQAQPFHRQKIAGLAKNLKTQTANDAIEVRNSSRNEVQANKTRTKRSVKFAGIFGLAGVATKASLVAALAAKVTLLGVTVAVSASTFGIPLAILAGAFVLNAAHKKYVSWQYTKLEKAAERRIDELAVAGTKAVPAAVNSVSRP
jgi:hypothetical protein